MTAYATHADLYRHGLPRGLLVEQARLVEDVDTSANTLVVANHGLTLNDPFRMVDDAGGVVGTLPSPLVSGTTYYAKPVDDSILQVAATVDGVAIDLSNVGAGTFGIAIDLTEEIDAVLEYYSRQVDRKLPAHAVPLTDPYPAEVVAFVAKLAARELLSRRGERVESVNEAAERVTLELRDWIRGVPLRDANATAPANLAISWGSASRGWGLDDDRVL